MRDPVEGLYRGYRIVSMPPPSSGGLTVIQVLKMLERFPIGDEEEGFGFGSTRTLNVMVEAMRLAFADRAVWMGDDGFVPVPSVGLLNDSYVAMRSALICWSSLPRWVFRQSRLVSADKRCSSWV